MAFGASAARRRVVVMVCRAMKSGDSDLAAVEEEEVRLLSSVRRHRGMPESCALFRNSPE